MYEVNDTDKATPLAMLKVAYLFYKLLNAAKPVYSYLDVENIIGHAADIEHYHAVYIKIQDTLPAGIERNYALFNVAFAGDDNFYASGSFQSQSGDSAGRYKLQGELLNGRISVREFSLFDLEENLMCIIAVLDDATQLHIGNDVGTIYFWKMVLEIAIVFKEHSDLNTFSKAAMMNLYSMVNNRLNN